MAKLINKVINCDICGKELISPKKVCLWKVFKSEKNRYICEKCYNDKKSGVKTGATIEKTPAKKKA